MEIIEGTDHGSRYLVIAEHLAVKLAIRPLIMPLSGAAVLIGFRLRAYPTDMNGDVLQGMSPAAACINAFPQIPFNVGRPDHVSFTTGMLAPINDDEHMIGPAKFRNIMCGVLSGYAQALAGDKMVVEMKDYIAWLAEEYGKILGTVATEEKDVTNQEDGNILDMDI